MACNIRNFNSTQIHRFFSKIQQLPKVIHEIYFEVLRRDITKLHGFSASLPFCVRTGAPDCRMPPMAKGLATVDIAQKSLIYFEQVYETILQYSNSRYS